jgi:hypothetical protein
MLRISKVMTIANTPSLNASSRVLFISELDRSEIHIGFCWLGLIFPKLLYRIPLTRFPGFIWLIAAEFLLPTTNASGSRQGSEWADMSYVCWPLVTAAFKFGSRLIPASWERPASAVLEMSNGLVETCRHRI